LAVARVRLFLVDTWCCLAGFA